ncbi:hypothetical protein CTRI78_v009421 [Colletotrichum trifolii]|uniref:Uncharacterized protein n=1 Tax=Colletotrichum trifolii TaxID=5466 RepID=A0A4V3HTZ3_COLTR|nr:hypothetical protein CTRI78_v009421 [Colletotrichum trifolii]
MPQWDEQVLGPASAIQIRKDYNNPPYPLTPDQLNLHYCRNCQLTWLDGNLGVPSPHAYHSIYANTDRTVVVFADGTCPPSTSLATIPSIGVYFGSESVYNISKRGANDGRLPTRQAAEIAAAAEALRKVRQTVEPVRRAMIRGMLPFAAEDCRRDMRQFRLVVATDSAYVVESMCKRIKYWTAANGTYRNVNSHLITNGRGFAELTDEVAKLSMMGIQVAWYHVPPYFNQEASRLARLALRS